VTIKPITPNEVHIEIPDKVIEVFNKLIKSNWDGDEAVVYQDDAVGALCGELKVFSSEIYGKHYLDVEEVYRKAGWYVEYDKPGFNDDYRAYYIFRKSP
jgi:hypothetical protein